MADFFPFDSGPGANVTEAQWGLMAKNWLGTGVIKGALNEFQVYADSTGMQVKVKSGNAWIQGFFFQVVTETVVPISAANATNPRIDRIAIKVDWTNNNISLIALQGTPASSPTPPALTQNTSIWQISLAQVYVAANASTIAAGNVTDERVFANITPFFFVNIGSPQSYGTANAIQQIPINSTNTTIAGVTIGTNEIQIQTAGKYMFEGFLDYSGLNNTQSAELLIRTFRQDNSYFDNTHLILGWSGLGSNYSSGAVPVSNAILVDCQVGFRVQFFARCSESPRNINMANLRGWRLGD